MGFYFRKSIRLGRHLRLNLSKSGIGVSAGVRGLRVGAGPRGTYIHAGAGGFYYRASLATGVKSRRSGAQSTMPAPVEARSIALREEEVESGPVFGMHDASAESLIAEINEKHRLFPRWPVAVLIGIALLFGTWDRLSSAQHGLGLVGLVIVFLVVSIFDARRSTTTITYQLDAKAAARYQTLVDALRELGRSERLWHIPFLVHLPEGASDPDAFASIKRAPTAVRFGDIPNVDCNLDVPSLGVGRQTLYFMPDYVLVFDQGSVGAVPYDALRVTQGRIQFVESQAAPSDARVVGQTWLHIRKDGLPDGRYKFNPEFPVCEYETIHFSSRSGLNELLYASRVGASDALVRDLGQSLPSRDERIGGLKGP